MKHTKPPYERTDTLVYALTENTDPSSRSRRDTPLVNRFSAQVSGGGRDGAPQEELEAVAELFRAAPEMDLEIRRLLNAYDAGHFIVPPELQQRLEALRAALPKGE